MSLESLQAYELLRKEKVEELHGTAYELVHKKTGARLFLVSSQDENKVFTIGFRTPPSDSTGVAHILEHSVLCGSEKFPVKDPFVELVKGSLNTFLNAMTYPDKTLYPVASVNDKDFQNLMNVYLDAVFHPNIYKNEKIFQQEGWHYELFKEQGPLTLNGVVYNEMKGALSSPDSLLDDAVAKSLFPDTTYGFESGGDPDEIPSLTYEKFLEFHKQYYHPSNSYIYLYGNMDMEEKLVFLDQAYLGKYDKLSVDSEIPFQEPFDKPKEAVSYYPVMEKEEKGAYLSYNVVVGTDLEPELYVAMQVLEYVLLNAPGAPLKQALLDEGIGKDVYGSYGNGILQPFFTIVAKEAKEEEKEKFVRVIEDTLRKLSGDGLKKSSLRAAMNYFEFKYREADFGPYPKGLMWGLQCFDSWLYGGDPLMHLKYRDTFRSLKEKMEQGYFEGLLDQYFLHNSHKTIVLLLPDEKMGARKEEALKEKLEDYRQSLSLEERKVLVEKTRALKAYQEAEDSPEALLSIPMLEREDISQKIQPLSTVETNKDGVFLLHHEEETSGITYLEFLFDMGGLSREEIKYGGLLQYVLSFVDTKEHSYGDLFDLIHENSGGLAMSISAFGNVENIEQYTGKFTAKIKVMEEKTDFAFSILEEILARSDFSSEKRMYEILAQLKSRMEMRFMSGSDGVALGRAASYASQASYFNELTGGIEFYRFVEDLEQNFPERKEDLVKMLRQVSQKLFSPGRLLVSITAGKEGFEKAAACVGQWKEALPGREEAKPMVSFALEQKNEGFQYSSGVQYVARYGNFREKGFAYTGALRVLRVILNYDYLWLNLRVKGGAYGCSSGFGKNGAGYFTSYRDPNLKKTNQVFEEVVPYMENFQVSDRDMTKYVIGAISAMDTPLTPQMKGSRSLTAYLSGITEDMLQKERREVLETQCGHIRALAPLVKAVLSGENICVLGNDRKLREEGDILKKVEPLFGQGKRKEDN